MKETYKIFGTMLFAAVAATSCVDDDALTFDVEKPQNIAQYEYLNSYEPLKTYVNRAAHPGFKVSGALTAADFSKKEALYRLASHNFDEVVAGNAMKMASCVDDKGNMSFDNVTAFVNAAEDAGISVFGHTLAWHAQQPAKWLASVLADREIEIDPNQKVDVVDYTLNCGTLTGYNWSGSPSTVVTTWGKDGTMEIYNPSPTPNWYELQYWLVNGIALKEGQEYTMKITMRVEGDNDALIRFKLGDWGGGDSKNFTVTPSADFQEIELKLTPTMASNGLFFQHGDFVGKVIYKSIEISHKDTPMMEIYTNVVSNSKMESGKPMSCFVVREYNGGGDKDGEILVGQGPEGMNCTKITSPSTASDAATHSTQFFITTDHVWAAGDKYHISFWYKASQNSSCETQCHVAPGGYKHWAMLPQNPSFTTEWQHYEAKGTIPSEGDGMRTIAFNLNVDREPVITYYFADIVWETIESGNKIPLTQEERHDTLVWAMDKWIGSMMEATEGKVKAWDVVNEAISGGGNVEGYYDLQHTPAEPAEQDFYWQDADKLGDIDYVRTAVASARKHFKGDAADLKLFINDYNLESTWDNNRKLESLIYWIGKWEADNVTKIDGIGTQMHISMVYGNDTTSLLENASRKAHIERMFRLMAESGKLCRVSELDLGVDTLNTTTNRFEGVKTKYIESLPLEKRLAIEKAQADYYKWILEKYFEIIPVAQQYGFCQWCLTDSPEDSGWRKGEPVGLWNLNYQRKPAYAGWAEGLKN